MTAHDAAYFRAYRASHATYRERTQTDAYRAALRERMRDWRYRLAPDQYNAMLAAQGGVCADCGGPETKTHLGRLYPLAIDHDHRCCPGKRSCGLCVRGIVRAACNNRRETADRSATP